MKILGISAYYHDSAAAITVDGDIIAAAQEERFTRLKHDASFPSHAIKYCLDEANLLVSDLDAVVFYDKPFLKFERLLETYYSFSPKGVMSFIKAIPVWVKEKLFLKSNLRKGLADIGEFDAKTLPILFPEHHLSHAASAFYPSPFDDSAILTIDGVGEWATATIAHGKGKNIEIKSELRFPHSVGLLYSAFTYFLGFKVNSGEYKMMGLAPYGNDQSERFLKLKKIVEDQLVDVKEDGSIWLNQSYFSYAHGLRMVHDNKWANLFGFKKRNSEEPIEQQHMDLALVVQRITEEVVVKLAKHAKQLTGSDNLCLAGGVALNCVSNGKLLDENIFKNVWIQPAAGDAGCALGAALAAHHIYFDQERASSLGDRMKGSYLGPAYSAFQITDSLKTYKADYRELRESGMTTEVAKLLAEGHIVGWFQGRMEFGPRALGHRSILGDARSTEMQTKLNIKIKYRESFRPFAPSLLADEVNEYFDIKGESPYMLLVRPLQQSRRMLLNDNYNGLPLMEKLRTVRSDIPAVTHVDFSGRIQTVDGKYNPTYYKLLQEFKSITDYGLIVNTSFNVRGEPIVCTPEDAYRCFMRTEMDYLVINNFIFEKTKQPNWENTDDWKTEFALD